MVGTWDLTDSSLDFLSTEMVQPVQRIVLKADGSFRATNLPRLFWNFEKSTNQAELYSGSGHWKVIEGNRLHLTLESGTGEEFFVDKALGGFKIHYFIGDPDEHRRLEYVRTSSS